MFDILATAAMVLYVICSLGIIYLFFLVSAVVFFRIYEILFDE